MQGFQILFWGAPKQTSFNLVSYKLLGELFSVLVCLIWDLFFSLPAIPLEREVTSYSKSYQIFCIIGYSLIIMFNVFISLEGRERKGGMERGNRKEGDGERGRQRD